MPYISKTPTTNLLFMPSSRSLHFKFLIFVLFSLTLLFIGACKNRALKKEISDQLIINLDLINEESPVILGEYIYNPDLVANIYTNEGDLISPKWSLRTNALQMLEVIGAVHQEGLNPEDYHFSAIALLADKISASEVADAEEVAQFELLLTDAFLQLSTHLSKGKVDAETIDPQWKAIHRDLNIDWAHFMDSTLLRKDIIEVMHNLTPNHREYNNLKKALIKYQQILANGGWEPITTNLTKFEKGMIHPDVSLIRKRLSLTQGEIIPDTDDENLFDESLHKQVMLFQSRNGLKADGVLGKESIQMLDISVEDRVASIEANLERWRWLSDELGERHIKINIANFELQLIDNGQTLFKSEAIVGRPYRQTPVFSSLMTYLVFNPDWTVPPTILKNDVIPAIIKDPNYLKQKKMRIITHTGNSVDASSIDWQRAAQSGFPYMIRQDPGPDNALGRVKFMFPNHHNVYIHDTPTRNLFAQTERTFSSGCIRVNHPLELARVLLASDDQIWTSDQINNVIAGSQPKTVRFKKAIPVHLLYLTAWADDEGVVYFRKDIYNRDQPLLMALKQKHGVPTDVSPL